MSLAIPTLLQVIEEAGNQTGSFSVYVPGYRITGGQTVDVKHVGPHTFLDVLWYLVFVPTEVDADQGGTTRYFICWDPTSRTPSIRGQARRLPARCTIPVVCQTPAERGNPRERVGSIEPMESCHQNLLEWAANWLLTQEALILEGLDE